MEAAKPEREIVNKGSGGRVCLAHPCLCSLDERERATRVGWNTHELSCLRASCRRAGACACTLRPSRAPVHVPTTDVASRISSEKSSVSFQLSGKALRDIPTVVNLLQLHTIKKADKNDPLKVGLGSEAGCAHVAWSQCGLHSLEEKLFCASLLFGDWTEGMATGRGVLRSDKSAVVVVVFISFT